MVTREKRLVHHSIKMTETEDTILQEKMKTFGINNMSAFIRAIILNGYLLKLDLPEIRELIRLMKNLTNNVNQIARRLNERGSIYETEIDEIQQRLQGIWNMINQLLTRLDLAND